MDLRIGFRRGRFETADRGAWPDLVVACLVVAALVVFVTRAASAISEITNTTTVSPQRFSGAPEVSIKTKTKYGWYAFPNPYASNYQINVDHALFNKPVRTGTNLGTDKVWVKKSNDTDLGGATSWRIQWGTWYVTGTQTRYYDAYANPRPLSSGTRTGLVSHGQYDCGPTNNNSCGAADVKDIEQHPAPPPNCGARPDCYTSYIVAQLP